MADLRRLIIKIRTATIGGWRQSETALCGPSGLRQDQNK
jgi:hypothetical protein